MTGEPDREGSGGDARVLAKSTLFNLLGLGAPLLVAVVAYRVFYDTLGEGAFGVLQLIQLIAGLTLFDVGLSRALTQLVARGLAEGDRRELPALVWTSLAIMCAVGMVGFVVTASIAPWLVDALDVEPSFRSEAITSFRIAGIAFIFIGLTAGLRGVLEAHLRFDITNIIRAPVGALLYLAPLGVLPFTTRLPFLAAAIVVTRAGSALVHLAACRRVMRSLGRPRLTADRLGTLLRFGGWMTVSNLVSPIMVTLDRFLIGILFTVAVVPFYAVPYDVVTRLLIAASAMSSVLFPQVARSLASDAGGVPALVDRAHRYLVVGLTPIVVLVVLFAREGMGLWMGEAFSAASTPVLVILAVGVLVNAIGHIPFAVVQAAGRADITARIHLVELPVYVALLAVLAHTFGLSGVAAAWSIRAAIDAALLYGVTRRVAPRVRAPWLGMVATAGATAVGVWVMLATPSLAPRVLLAAVAIALGIVAALRLLRAAPMANRA